MPHPVPHRWDSSGEEHTLRSLIPPHGLYTHTNNRVKKFYVVFEILPREVGDGEGGGVNKFTMGGVLVTYKKNHFIQNASHHSLLKLEPSSLVNKFLWH